MTKSPCSLEELIWEFDRLAILHLTQPEKARELYGALTCASCWAKAAQMLRKYMRDNCEEKQ